VGLGLRQNLARPVKNIFVQLLTQASFNQHYGQTTYSGQTPAEVLTSQQETLNLFLGPGFEAFLPFWENISLEVSLGLNVNLTWYQQQDDNSSSAPLPNTYSANWSSLGASMANTSTSLLNAAVHFYF
jgi:hypothetical protein